MPRFSSRNASYSISVGGTTNGGLSIANASSLNPTAAVTVETSFYLESLNAVASAIVDNSTAGTTNSYYVDVLTNGTVGNLRFYATIGGVSKSVTVTSTSILPRQWYFLSVTYTGSAMTIFLNGSQIGTLAGLSGSMGTNSNALVIGRNHAGTSTLAVNGYVYRPRVYRASCSLTEHQDRYYNDLTSSALQAGLVLDLAMTGGSGTTIADVSGQGNNATIVSPATWTAFSPFKQRLAQRNYNAALSFAGGSGSVVSITDASDLRFATGFTVVARAYLNTRTGDAFKGIVSKGGTASGGERNYLLALNNGNTLLNCGYEIVGGTNQFATGTRVIPLNQWFMPGVTWDGANVQCYQDGTVDGSAFAATGTPCMTAADLEIGRNQNNTQEWDGIISDVIIWNRALTAQEMSDLYFSGIIPTSGFVDRWRLDEGAGGTANSQTGTHNGTVTSAVWTGNTPMKARKLINGNMVPNGDFEYAPPFTAVTTGGNVWLDGSAAGSATNDLFRWYKINGAGAYAASFDSTTKYAGNYSIKMEETDATGRGRLLTAPFESSTTAALVAQYGIPASPSTDYDVNAYIKTNAASASSVRILVLFYTASGTQSGSYTGSFQASTQEFTAAPGRFTTASTTSYLVIKLDDNTASGAAHQVWFDSVSLTPVYPEGRVPANGNLVKNFDFEVAPTFVAAQTTKGTWLDGSAGGSASNNTYKWGYNSTNSSGTGAVQFDSSTSNSGIYSLKVSTTASGATTVASNMLNTSVSQLPFLIRVNPNTSYSYSFAMRTNYISGDSADGACLQFKERNATAGTIQTTQSTKIKTTTGWTIYSGTFTTQPTSTQYLDIEPSVIGATGTATLIMDAWFDDIYLAPTTNPGRVQIT